MGYMSKKQSPPRTRAQKAQHLGSLLCSGQVISSSEINALCSGLELTAIINQWALMIPPGPVGKENQENLDTLFSVYKHHPEINTAFELLEEQNKWWALLCLVQRVDRQSVLERVAQKILANHPADPPDNIRAVLSHLTFRISEHIDKSLDKVIGDGESPSYMNSVVFSANWNFGGKNRSMELLRTLVQCLGSRVFDDTALFDTFSNIERKAILAQPQLSNETSQEVQEALTWMGSAKKKYKLTGMTKSDPGIDSTTVSTSSPAPKM